MKIKKYYIFIAVLLIALFSLSTWISADSNTGEKSPDILITSVGQSADDRMIKVVADKLQLACDFERLAKQI